MGSDLQSTTSADALKGSFSIEEFIENNHNITDPYKWYSDGNQLMKDLVEGNTSLHNPKIQKRLLNWMTDERYNVFRDVETGDEIYALGRKRGNKAYAAKKTEQKNKLCRALDGKEFDYPIGGRGDVRMTRLLFITVNFDRDQFTTEQAWASLRSTPIEGVETTYNVLNKLNANLTKIFGPHAILTCKEAQSSGYPAPHIIVVLEKPVKVRLHTRGGKNSWRIDDRRILRRIRKDSDSRKLSYKDYKEAIKDNKIWPHGFIDFQGIVKGYKVHGKRDAFTYAFKYLTKYLVDSKTKELESLETIDSVENPSLRTALFTHLGNKCFRTRDISFTKKFINAIGGLNDEDDKSFSSGNKWKRIRSVPAFVVDWANERKEHLELERAKRMLDPYRVPSGQT
ncbi:MAG: hypothetical protein IJT54_04880 [Candidatus Methanomethylophilaceae archaeon]|nr:hypothetical protein [Candidatus Methanomethylophilaceae archaeon]